MFHHKPVRILITGEAKEEFIKMTAIVEREILSGITNSKTQILFNAIKSKIELLKRNPQWGVHIQKNLIPKEYVSKYGITNLWKLNLPGAWRLIYTIKGDKIEIIVLMLDIFSHKDYDRKFGY